MQGFFSENPQEKAVKIIRYKIKGNATTIANKMFGYTFYNITTQVSNWFIYLPALNFMLLRYIIIKVRVKKGTLNIPTNIMHRLLIYTALVARWVVFARQM